jgi:predicted nucleotidyltransferase
MHTELIIQKLAANKEVLRRQYRIAKIGLFGSYSRNTQGKDSDIDLVIELEQGEKLGFKESYDLEEYLKQLLDTDRIDIVDQKYMNPVIESEMIKSVVYV